MLRCFIAIFIKDLKKFGNLLCYKLHLITLCLSLCQSGFSGYGYLHVFSCIYMLHVFHLNDRCKTNLPLKGSQSRSETAGPQNWCVFTVVRMHVCVCLGCGLPLLNVAAQCQCDKTSLSAALILIARSQHISNPFVTKVHTHTHTDLGVRLSYFFIYHNFKHFRAYSHCGTNVFAQRSKLKHMHTLKYIIHVLCRMHAVIFYSHGHTHTLADHRRII